MNKYKILDVIGNGGSSNVYKVEDTHKKETLAMKVIPFEYYATA